MNAYPCIHVGCTYPTTGTSAYCAEHLHAACFDGQTPPVLANPTSSAVAHFGLAIRDVIVEMTPDMSDAEREELIRCAIARDEAASK